MSDITVNVNLIIKTCECGLVYAVPNWIPSYNFRCPTCTGRQHSELRKERDNALFENERLNHVINGLRGALKKRGR